MLSTFLDSSLLVQDFGFNQDELYFFIKSVTGETSLTAFVGLILLCHGKDSVSVSDNLELESTEIKIMQRLFVDNKDILSLSEELMFLITAIHISEASD
jgi:hypothetical protein